jgi:hypothetical protein
MPYFGIEDSPGHARGTYRDNAKALTKITHSLRCNFGVGIHPRVNAYFHPSRSPNNIHRDRLIPFMEITNYHR